MRNERRLARVIHRVGQVAHEDDVFGLVHHLADRERTAEHAHVEVNTHDNDVVDAALLHQVVGFGRISDRVAVSNLKGRNLASPRRTTRTLRPVIAASVRIVDRQRGFADGIQGAPALKRHLGRRRGSGLRQLPLRGVLVERHRAARAMNDEHPALARLVHHLVHAWRHLGDASGRAVAPMLVPHVADDDCSLHRVPLDGRLGHLPLAVAFSSLDARTRRKL